MALDGLTARQPNGEEVWFLLDGVDEVSHDERLFLRVCDGVRALAREAHVILTSRRAGYRTGLAPSRLCELIELSEDSARALIESWHAHVQPLDGESGAAFAAEVFDHESTRALARSPCLLSLLCYIRATHADVPLTGRKTRIYERAINILCEDARQERSIDVGRDGLRWLAAFSFWLFCRQTLPRQVFEGDNVDRFCSASGAPSGLLERWLGTRLLARWSRLDDLFHFTHLTFQEWFVARHVAALPDEELALVVGRYAFNPYWREVWTFAAGFWAEQEGSGPRRLRMLLDETTRAPDLHGLTALHVAHWVGEGGVRLAVAAGRPDVLAALVGLVSHVTVTSEADCQDAVVDESSRGRFLDAIARAMVVVDREGAQRWALANTDALLTMPTAEDAPTEGGAWSRRATALCVLRHLHSPSARQRLFRLALPPTGARGKRRRAHMCRRQREWTHPRSPEVTHPMKHNCHSVSRS